MQLATVRFTSCYQLPPDPQIQRPQQGLKHRISNRYHLERSLFFFLPLYVLHPSLSLLTPLGILSSLGVFHLSILRSHILK